MLFCLLCCSWCTDARVKVKLSQQQQPADVTADVTTTSPLVRYPLPINTLVELPRDYSEIINRSTSFT